jgi:hypothetical protein
MHLSKNILLKVDAKNLPSAVFFLLKGGREMFIS